MLQAGIRTFVSLLEESEMKSFYPYKQLILEQDASATFISFVIPDGSTAQDDAVDKFTDELVVKVLDSKEPSMLVHCWGGHGRTGTIAAIVLAKLYKLRATETLQRIQAVHDCRQDTRAAFSPETSEQVNQVRLLISNMHSNPKE